MKVKSKSEVAQLCSTLSDPMDCSLPGSFVHGIFQARVLEWVASAFSYTSDIVMLLCASAGTSRLGRLQLQQVAAASFRFHILDTIFTRSFFGEGDGTPLQYSCLENPMDEGAWWAAVHGVAKSRTRLSDFTFTFHFHALEKEMATHSSVLAWRIPGMGEPGGLPSMGSHRVGHD